MNKGKIKIFTLEILLIGILFFALFASNVVTRSILSIILFVYMFVVSYFLKKRKITSMYKKQVTVLMVIFGIIYVVILYLLGLHFGFVKSKVVLSIWTLFKYIVPLTVIILSSELVRKVFLSQRLNINIRSIKFNLSPILTFVAMVLIDVLIYTGVYNLANLDDFLTALGFVFFASISCNLLYNYISVRFGNSGIICFRLLTSLYMYIIPFVPDIYLFFNTFLKMVYPFLVYLVFEKTYSKSNFVVAYKDKKREFVGNAFLLVIMVLFIMLISCQFKYGIIVIGSKSMTGTINKGDAVIFEKYEGQHIENGQVIMFDYNDMQTIHRVVEIRKVNGEVRYYTKGDANKKIDAGYVTEDKIKGLIKLKVKYIGYPTLWVRNLFD